MWTRLTRTCRSLAIALLAVGALAWAGPAAATVYAITSGTSLVTATVGATPVGTGSITFDGSFVEFVTSPSPLVVDLELTATAQGPYTIMLPPVFPDYDELVIDSLLIEPGTSFSSFGSGSNPFSFTVTGLKVTGTATLSDSTAVLGDVTSPFLIENSTFTGSITLGPGGLLEMNGIEIASLDVDGPGGPLPPIVLKADNVIQAIPEPGTAWLLGLGAAGLAARSRRAR